MKIYSTEIAPLINSIEPIILSVFDDILKILEPITTIIDQYTPFFSNSDDKFGVLWLIAASTDQSSLFSNSLDKLNEWTKPSARNYTQNLKTCK